MLGLTTTARLRASENKLAAKTYTLKTARAALTDAYSEIINERAQAERDHAAYNRRLVRALRSLAHWRAEAARERRIVTRLAGQLLDATSGQNAAARKALGLPVLTPWDRAVDGLNALTEAGITCHSEPSGDLANSEGPERITWDRENGCWALIHVTGPDFAPLDDAEATDG